MEEVRKEIRKAVEERSETAFNMHITECRDLESVFTITLHCAALATKASFFEKLTLENMMERGFKQMLALRKYLQYFDWNYAAARLAPCLLELKNEGVFEELINQCRNLESIFSITIGCADRALKTSGLERNTLENMMEHGFKRILELCAEHGSNSWGNGARRLVSCLKVMEGYFFSSSTSRVLDLRYSRVSETLGYFLLTSCPQVIASDEFPKIREFLATRLGFYNHMLILDNAFKTACYNERLGPYFNFVDAFIKMKICREDYVLTAHGEFIAALFRYWRAAKTGSMILLSNRRLPTGLVKEIKLDIAKRINWVLRVIHHSTIDLSLASKERATLVSAFHTASSAGNANLVLLLSMMGVNIQHVTECHLSSPLMEAVSLGHTEVVRVLLEKGMDVNTLSDKGDSCILMAVATAHIEVVRILLKYGADVNKPALRDEETPLSIAVRRGYREIVQMLLKSGAKITSAILEDAKNKSEISELLKQAEKSRAQVKQVGTTFMGIGVGRYKRGIFASEQLKHLPPDGMRLIGRMIKAASTPRAV